MTTETTPKPVNETRQRKNAERKVAKTFLRSKLNDEKLPEDVRKALKIVIGTGERAVGQKGSPLMDKIRELFAKSKSVDELTLFKETKMGRGEMRKRCRLFIKDCEPAERLWIAFNEEKETWDLKGTGEAMPKGWTGYIPVEAV